MPDDHARGRRQRRAASRSERLRREVLGHVRAPDDRGRRSATTFPRRRRRPSPTRSSTSTAIHAEHDLPSDSPATSRRCRSRAAPGFDGATGWLNSPPLTPAGLRGQGRARRLLDVHLHQLAAHARLRPRLGREVRRQGLVVVGVHTPEFPFERDLDNVRAGRAGHAGRAIRSRSTTTTPSGTRSPTTTGRPSTSPMPTAASAITSSARAATRRPSRSIQQLLREAGAPASATTRRRSPATGSRRRPTGRPASRPRPTSATSRAEQFASPGGVRLRRAARLRRAGALALNHWALAGEWTIERRRGRARPSRRPDRVPLPRPRRQPRAPATGRGAGAVPRAARRRAARRRPRARRRQQGNGRLRAAALPAHPPAGVVADRTFEITFVGAGAEAYVFTFG